MANSLKSLIKTGFGLGLGLYLAQIVFLLIGMAIFFPAYAMLQKKQRNNSPLSEKIFPILIMTIGVVIMGGAGFGLLMDSAGDIFE
jgi:uncharacterized protein YneF (UPF0154 family)